MTKISFNFFLSFLVLTVLTSAFSSALHAKSASSINLTTIEQAWLEKHPIIRVGPDIAWPPIEWVDNQHEYMGMVPDYLSLIEDKLGIQFDVEKNKSWPQIIEGLKNKEIDISPSIAKNPERLKYLNFTRPYLSFPMVIITTNKVHYIDGVKGLKNLDVSVVKGYATQQYLATRHPSIQLHIVDSSEEGLRTVSKGETDVFIDNLATATQLIQQLGLTNLKISGDMPIRYKLGMGVRKDWPELVSILQRALDSISQDQRQSIYNKWIGLVLYEHGFNYFLFWQILVGFIIILSLFYFQNRKLSHEVAQRRITQQLLTNERNKADKANKAKSDFLSVITHELRTPLTAIKGAIGLLASGKVVEIPEKAQGMLFIADKNSDRLNFLINDLLDIEKMLAGEFVFNKSPTSISALIHNAVIANQGYADKYDIFIDVDIELNQLEARPVLVDENRLMQVFANLMSNAIKHSPKGSHIKIHTQYKGNVVRVSVTDKGEGIPDEFKERIFTRFSQAESSVFHEKDGTGLGLVISKEIIERHGGRIGFESTYGQGAMFYFELDLI